MKNIKQILTLLVISALINSCESDDKTVDNILAQTTRGAVLRTLSEDGDYDLFATDKTLEITLQQQDLEKGGLLDRVEMVLSYIDNNFEDEDNESDRESVLRSAFRTLAASDFTTGDSGLPEVTFSVSLAEALSTTGISLDQVLPGDQFLLDLELFLTDGRSFTAADASGNVSGGSFFSSPFQYSLTVDDGISFALRTRNDGINVANKTGINIADGADNFNYEVDITINDGDEGALLQTLNIYREFIDRSIEDDGINRSEDEMIFETYTISDLNLSAEGVRNLGITYTLDQLYGSNLNSSLIGLNDEFRLRYEIVTQDGRKVTTKEEGSEYFVIINVFECNLLNVDTPFPGEYTLTFFDSFGDGWDGASIDVSIDGGSVGSFTITGGESGSSTFTVPEGAASLTLTYVAGNFEEEHSYIIIDPNGNQAAADGPTPKVGEIAIAICE